VGERVRRAHRREVSVLADRLRARLLGDTQPRTKVGRYQLRRRIGRGATATVYEAFDERLERTVAIKFIHPEHQGRARTEARLQREAHALARLSHPNIVAIYDAGEEDGELYLVMELLPAGTLYHWQAETLRPIAALLEVYLAVGEGLQAAHEAGVWHRDFKPTNVALERGGTPKLVDFGLAALMPIEPSATSLALTQSGTAMGTRGYMAPEQAAGRPADARSDQFSFCAALEEAILEGSTTKTMPVALEEVLRRGRAPDPGERWASMAELLDGLRRARATLGEGTARALPPGMDFPEDRYLFLYTIGEGASSVVVLAQHRTLHHRVAIKLLRAGLCDGPRTARLLEEARLIATLRHPNIVRVHDAGFTANGTPYLEMEYLPGEDLATRLARCGPRPWSEVREIGIGLARALTDVHALQVVHRDVKPSNCRWVAQGSSAVVQLLDFGVARRARTYGAPENIPVGTPLYMAPEQLAGSEHDHRVDVYALGVTLYELLTGALPHHGSTPETLFEEKAFASVASPRRGRDEVPRAAEAFFERALASDPDRRFPSMEALLVALQGATSGERRRRRRWLPWSAALGASCLLGLATLSTSAGPRMEGLWLDAGLAPSLVVPRHRPPAWDPPRWSYPPLDSAPTVDAVVTPIPTPALIALPPLVATDASEVLRDRCQLYAYPGDEARMTLALGSTGAVARVGVRGVASKPLQRCLVDEGRKLSLPPKSAKLGDRVRLRVVF